MFCLHHSFWVPHQFSIHRKRFSRVFGWEILYSNYWNEKKTSLNECYAMILASIAQKEVSAHTHCMHLSLFHPLSSGNHVQVAYGVLFS